LVLSAKVFKLSEYIPIDIIYDKISGYRVKEDYEGIEVQEYFEDINVIGGMIKGFYIYDEVRVFNVGGELRNIPIRREVPIIFIEYRGAEYLIIFEKKPRANKIAIKISEILFIRGDMIIEAFITHETLKSLHESAPEATKVIYFDNVDLPNINKLALYGDSLADTSLYNEYLKHGLIWYVVFQHRDTGYVVGITRNAIIAMFTNITLDEFQDFILRHILPLISS